MVKKTEYRFTAAESRAGARGPDRRFELVVYTDEGDEIPIVVPKSYPCID